MNQNAAVPDAWDDEDWESQADVSISKHLSVLWDGFADDFFKKQASGLTPAQPTAPEQKVSAKVSKAQKRAQHAEFNRQLWAEAYVSAFQFTYYSLVSKT